LRHHFCIAEGGSDLNQFLKKKVDLLPEIE